MQLFIHYGGVRLSGYHAKGGRVGNGTIRVETVQWKAGAMSVQQVSDTIGVILAPDDRFADMDTQQTPGEDERKAGGRTGPRIPASDLLGFRAGVSSVHTSRTMMLNELQLLLENVNATAPASAYSDAIMEDNVLGKPTRTTRQRTLTRLKQLYSLDPGISLFRLLRHFWPANNDAQPMLAFLVAAARDPLLRETTPHVLNIPVRQPVQQTETAQFLDEKYPARFRPTTLKSTAQNIASSWTQAGYLTGRVKKNRTRPNVTPAVVTFALVIGHLCGLRGKLLVDCLWTRLLDRSQGELTDLAMEASKQGWMLFKSSGVVIEVTFPGLLTPKEEQVAYEQD